MPFEFRERYLFVEKLGSGGQGVVFRAYDRQAVSEPWVAVKVAPVKSEASKEMFRREGRAAAILAEHPQYFVGFRGSDFNDPAYLVLEFVPWPTLKKMRAIEGNLPPLDVARLGVEILRGVRCMERRKMVHRDLKPDNIFARRCDDGSFEVKIADLGVWVDAGASDKSLLGSFDDTNGFFGTPPYMSPEQLRGGVVTAASDVHAVASVLWLLATGSLPFPMKPGVSEEEKRLDRLQKCRFQPSRPASMPEELYLILAIALRFNPEERVFVDPQTLAGSENAANDSAPRGMEKALRRFIEDYGERRKRSLIEKAIKVQLLEASLASGEKKIATAQKLSVKAEDFRARLERLNSESTGFDGVLDGLRAMESQIEAWNAAVEDFVDARRSEIEDARRVAEAEAKRADEWEKKATELEARVTAGAAALESAETRHRAELLAHAEAGAKLRESVKAAEARAVEHESRAKDAELRLRGAVTRRAVQVALTASLTVIGLCVGFGLSSFVHSRLSVSPSRAHAQIEPSSAPTAAPAVTTAAPAVTTVAPAVTTVAPAVATAAPASTASAASSSAAVADGRAGDVAAAPSGAPTSKPSGTASARSGGSAVSRSTLQTTVVPGPSPSASASSATNPTGTRPPPSPPPPSRPSATGGGKIVTKVRD